MGGPPTFPIGSFEHLSLPRSAMPSEPLCCRKKKRRCGRNLSSTCSFFQSLSGCGSLLSRCSSSLAFSDSGKYLPFFLWANVHEGCRAKTNVDDASFALVLLLSSSFCFLNLHPRLTSGFPVSLRRRSLVVDAMVVCLKDFPPRVELEHHFSQEVPIFDLPNSTHISCTALRFFVLSSEVPFFQEAQGVPSFLVSSIRKLTLL